MVSVRVLLKTLLFTVLVPGTVAVAIPHLLAGRHPDPSIPIGKTTGRVVGGFAVLAGTVLYLRTAFQFAAEGRGTPSPTDDPEELVTGGIYSRSRNPMYVGVLLVIVGHAFIRRSASVGWWAVGCWIGFHNRVLRYEEPHLAEKHGEAYEAYRERVPRWLPSVR